jgi:hypothetical protein
MIVTAAPPAGPGPGRQPESRHLAPGATVPGRPARPPAGDHWPSTVTASGPGISPSRCRHRGALSLPQSLADGAARASDDATEVPRWPCSLPTVTQAPGPRL